MNRERTENSGAFSSRSVASLALRAFITSFFAPALSLAGELCLYTSEDGRTHQVNSRAEVPAEKRSSATCIENKSYKKNSRPRRSAPQYTTGNYQRRKKRNSAGRANSHLAAPGDIELRGTVRRESMPSSIGRIELRWPRKIEKLFGRTPVRAMAEAARAVSRAVKKPGFPLHVQRLDIDWEVVFLDADLPTTQIPTYLISNCHPAWMTPPSNIYVVGQRVVAGCGNSARPSTSVADSRLAEVLIHEIGHAVEYQLDRKPGERARREGFATWFEAYVAEFSPLVDKRKITANTYARARQSFRMSPNQFHFSGSSFDYARASLYFFAIERKKRVMGVMEVYDLMREENLDFFSAVEKRMGWNRREFEEEVRKIVR